MTPRSFYGYISYTDYTSSVMLASFIPKLCHTTNTADFSFVLVYGAVFAVLRESELQRCHSQGFFL